MAKVVKYRKSQWSGLGQTHRINKVEGKESGAKEHICETK